MRISFWGDPHGAHPHARINRPYEEELYHIF
jgi:hypothetical protein